MEGRGRPRHREGDETDHPIALAEDGWGFGIQ